MLEISKSLGLCKKNILTHLYTATWRIVGEPKTLLDLSRFHTFSTVACEGEYARVHIRKWIYGQEFKKELKGGSDDGPTAFRTGDLSYIFGDGY